MKNNIKKYEISEKDLEDLCYIARALNDIDEEEPDFMELWEMLVNVIENIKE